MAMGSESVRDTNWNPWGGCLVDQESCGTALLILRDPLSALARLDKPPKTQFHNAALAEIAVQPEAGNSPLALHCGGGDPQHFRRILDRPAPW